MTIENANRLSEMRRAHGLSQEELAERLNISRQAISKWERAESSPDTDNLIALAQLYGVSLDVLLGLQVPERPLAPGEAAYEAPAAPEDTPPFTDLPEAAPLQDDGFDPASVQPDEPAPGPNDDPLPHGSYFDYKEKQEARTRQRNRYRYPYPVIIATLYLVLGFLCNWWHPGWLMFLTIPLFYLPEDHRTPLRLLGNPVFVTLVYLLLGFMCNLWHPGWLIFLLIPVLNAFAWRK